MEAQMKFVMDYSAYFERRKNILMPDFNPVLEHTFNYGITFPTVKSSDKWGTGRFPQVSCMG